MPAHFLQNLLFPKRCVGCGKIEDYVCSDCLNKISLYYPKICPQCGKPSANGLTHLSCRKTSSLQGLIMPFKYKGIARKLIIDLKYRFVSDIVSILSDLFITQLSEDKIISDLCQHSSVLIPVPLHSQRYKWRGFNQVELLGQEISRQLKIGFYKNGLLRIKNTSPQTNLNRKQRLNNIKNSFHSLQVPKGIKNIIIFDDVWTTGATIKEAVRQMIIEKNQRLWAMVIAGD